MPEIYLHGKPIESVFELLGKNENDITYAIGWALANSQAFQQSLVSHMLPGVSCDTPASVHLQEYQRGTGITDIELIGNAYHLIIEAKRGWRVPGEDQLERYASRFGRSEKGNAVIVSMSECSREYAKLMLCHQVNGVPVKHVSWKRVATLAKNVRRAPHAEKRLLRQLHTYLRKIVQMQDQTSNMVYVVSIAKGSPQRSRITWKDIIRVEHRYFHVVGKGGWPSSPPNYMGFRWDGKLQQIRHVDAWKITEDLHEEIDGMGKGVFAYPNYLYTLGPNILPETKRIKKGKVYPSGRIWAMLDLLLTCDTVAEARDLTKKRLNGSADGQDS